MHSHDFSYPIYNQKYNLFDYAYAFPNDFESNTHAMRYILHLLLKANGTHIQIFSEKGYGLISSFKEEARFHFRCEFNTPDSHLLHSLQERLGCEIFKNKDKYVLFIDEELLYSQINAKLQRLWSELSLPGELKKGEYKEFEYLDSISAIKKNALKDFGLELITSDYPSASIQGIKINNFDFLTETKLPLTEEKRMPSIHFFPESFSSAFKLLPDFTDEERMHIASIQLVIKQLDREIQSCWSIFYNINLKLAKKRYLQDILGHKHLTRLPFNECIAYVNEHFITMDDHLDRIYTTADVLGGIFSHRVRDCIDRILVTEVKPAVAPMALSVSR